ncbi:MAG: bifunctional UDP-N-acetylglucosamine diphosphorylase/glucosamine-1-phosphate N-acetyltransferase GlmU [Steroidobacterales bacterium]
MTIVILAAGQGKRMHSDLPKVLQPLAGTPLLKHVIDCARSLDAAAIHVVYGHGGDAVPRALAAEPVNWVHQAEQLGTGHAVTQAMAAIPDDHLVLVLYGDVPLVQRETLARLLASAGNDTIALLSVMLDDPTGYGRIVRDAAGRVVRIVEQKDATHKELAIREVNTGLLAAPAARLRSWLASLRNDNAQREYYLTDIVVAAVRDGLSINAMIAPTRTEVLGVNDKIQLAEVETENRRRRARELMIAGATLADPERIDVRGELEIGTDVFIDVNAVFVGKVKLGSRVKIGPNCYLRDTTIGDDTELFPNCVIDKATIGANCQIGPFARFRPTSTLSDRVHIGNFVEVKNTAIGEASKANHLSYLGDAVIGSRVNVGAGTITVNYDGANKHRTTIEDDVHIGSGNMLIAPVTIEKGANTGAGSTITKNAPAGKLTLARSKQVTIEGWQRPQKKKPEKSEPGKKEK